MFLFLLDKYYEDMLGYIGCMYAPYINFLMN